VGYFFSRTWPWWLLTAVLAALIAWLLCRWWTRRTGADLTAGTAGAGITAGTADTAELTRVQGLLTGREDELSRLQAAHATLEAEHATLATTHATLTTEHSALTAERDSLTAGRAGAAADGADAGALQAQVDDLNTQVATLAGRLESHQGDRSRLTAAYGRIAELEGDLAARPVATVPDVQAGAAALGQQVRLDDLTLVEGIGPKIAELCHEAGVRTWRELATTPVERLRQILDAAGPRFQMHDPGTWPRQAALLADGHWEPFKAWTDALKGGRPDQ